MALGTLSHDIGEVGPGGAYDGNFFWATESGSDFSGPTTGQSSGGYHSHGRTLNQNHFVGGTNVTASHVGEGGYSDLIPHMGATADPGTYIEWTHINRDHLGQWTQGDHLSLINITGSDVVFNPGTAPSADLMFDLQVSLNGGAFMPQGSGTAGTTGGTLTNVTAQTITYRLHAYSTNPADATVEFDTLGIDGSYEVVYTPEPGSALLATLVGGLLLLRRRR